MAEYTFTERLYRQRVYMLRLPSNAVELEKMLQAAYRDNAREGVNGMDDGVRLEADEEMITLTFDLPELPAAPAAKLKKDKKTKTKDNKEK